MIMRKRNNTLRQCHFIVRHWHLTLRRWIYIEPFCWKSLLQSPFTLIIPYANDLTTKHDCTVVYHASGRRYAVFGDL